MQVAIRNLSRAYNQKHAATLNVTSHFMDDVVALCPRIIVIDRCTLIHDGDLRALVKQMDPDKRVSFTTDLDNDALAKLGTVLTKGGNRITVRNPEGELPKVCGHQLGERKVGGLASENEPAEDI